MYWNKRSHISSSQSGLLVRSLCKKLSLERNNGVPSMYIYPRNYWFQHYISIKKINPHTEYTTEQIKKYVLVKWRQSDGKWGLSVLIFRTGRRKCFTSIRVCIYTLMRATLLDSNFQCQLHPYHKLNSREKHYFFLDWLLHINQYKFRQLIYNYKYLFWIKFLIFYRTQHVFVYVAGQLFLLENLVLQKRCSITVCYYKK